MAEVMETRVGGQKSDQALQIDFWPPHRDREIRRCLKRHLARRIFKLLRLGVDSL